MSESIYEITVLDSGDVALRKVGEGDTAPLVSVRFSAEAQDYLGEFAQQIGRAMIGTGVKLVSEISSSPEPRSAESQEVGDADVYASVAAAQMQQYADGEIQDYDLEDFSAEGQVFH